MNDLRDKILATAKALGIDPVDLATAISYETAGTFDATKRGPTTQWGQHRGFIQFGEPQAERYGVDWNNPVDSQLGENGAVANYLRDTGVQPGMGLLDIYSAINAGGVGRYGASDANNGGAPSTVRDKVEKQMGGHRAKAQALLAGAGMAAPSMPEFEGPMAADKAPLAPWIFGQMGVPMESGGVDPVRFGSPAMPFTPQPTQSQPPQSALPDRPMPMGPMSHQNLGPMAPPAPAPKGGGITDILGAMAMMSQPEQPQFSPVNMQGPSPEQANALTSFIQALKQGAMTPRIPGLA